MSSDSSLSCYTANSDVDSVCVSQATTLEQLMTQLSLLETEMKALTESHVKTSAIMQEQEEALTRERRHAEQWKAKYKVVCSLLNKLRFKF